MGGNRGRRLSRREATKWGKRCLALGEAPGGPSFDGYARHGLPANGKARPDIIWISGSTQISHPLRAVPSVTILTVGGPALVGRISESSGSSTRGGKTPATGKTDTTPRALKKVGPLRGGAPCLPGKSICRTLGKKFLNQPAAGLETACFHEARPREPLQGGMQLRCAQADLLRDNGKKAPFQERLGHRVNTQELCRSHTLFASGEYFSELSSRSEQKNVGKEE